MKFIKIYGFVVTGKKLNSAIFRSQWGMTKQFLIPIYVTCDI